MQIGTFQYNVREKCLFGEFEVSYVSNNSILYIYPHFKLTFLTHWFH